MLLSILLSCNYRSEGRFQISGYSAEEEINLAEWIVIREWDEGEKYFYHHLDKSLKCRTVGKKNIIYTISKNLSNPTEIEEIRQLLSTKEYIIQNNLNRQLNNCTQQSWIDTHTKDQISVFECKNVNQQNLEIKSISVEILNYMIESKNRK